MMVHTNCSSLNRALWLSKGVLGLARHLANGLSHNRFVLAQLPRRPYSCLKLQRLFMTQLQSTPHR